MKTKAQKKIIYLALLLMVSQTASAESLFQTGVSQSVYPMHPKSLFSTVRAKTIGDIITIIIDENSTTTNDVKLSVSDESTLGDNFTGVIEDLFTGRNFGGTRWDLPDLDGFGGDSSTSNNANVQRTMKLTDTMTAQVVQVLPNGNLVVQGKKMVINSGEQTQIVISGIVDPRFINNAGTVKSSNIANLQFAATGSGTVSRHDSEGLMNRVFGYMF